jgi:nitroimidazol reductase NimA-like FMN-containing flavoprotein (pyridoxamine 5'-phosphate oxidase superfamily)
MGGAYEILRWMPEPSEHETAKRILDENLYMVVATADRGGQPWASPVYFAHSGYRELFWVSDPEADHSTNLRERREVGIVVFDSSAPIGTGQGVYISGVAQELPAHETAEPIEIYSKRSVGHGGGKWTAEDVRPPSRHRLFRASAEAIYVLDEHDHRVEVDLR